MQNHSPSNFRRCIWMVLAALAIRLTVVAFLYLPHLDPAWDYWNFAGEVGHIAESLVHGRGYGNPLFGTTGPTAWLPPVYPLLVAGAFKVFGAYTKASALVLLSLNSLFSALTCLPVYFLARRGFGERVGVWAGWVWAFFPYAVYFSADILWPTTLCTLLLTVLLACVLRLETAQGPRSDFAFGMLSGLAALTDPIVISVLPFVAAWMYSRRRRQGLRWRVPATAMAAGFVLMVTPWFVRNYETFHAFIPFRDGFGLELHIGNHGDSSRFAPTDDNPSPTNDAEVKAYTELGEQAYMAAKLKGAVAFITSHPEWFAVMTLRRVLYMWTSYWSFDPQYMDQLDHKALELPSIFLTVVLDLAALAGLYRAFRQGSSAAMPLALVLLFFPMIYYVTHGQDYFRRPIDPVFVVLATYEVWSRFQRGGERFPPAGEISAGAAG